MVDVETPKGVPAHRQQGLSPLSASLVAACRPAAQRVWPTARMLARPLGLYLASRLLVYAAIGVVVMLKMGLAPVHFAGPWPLNSPSRPLFEALGVWDGSWYLHIMQHGYATTSDPAHVAQQVHPFPFGLTGQGDAPQFYPSVAFLPFLPMVIKAIAFVTGLKALHAGILTAFIIGALASVCVWLFVHRLTDVSTADRATALWCFFPGAITLSLIYSEGLLVVLAIICLYCLMRQRWVVAGIAALLASATAPEGLVLAICCAWAAGAALLHGPSISARRGSGHDRGHELGRGDGHGKVDSLGGTPPLAGRRWLAPIAPLLAPMGFLAYQAYLWARTGDITYWYWAEKQYWQGGFDPWRATIGNARLAYQHPGLPDFIVPTLMLFVLVAAVILLWRWKPPAIVTIYAVLTMALALCSGALGARPRFFIAAFPLIVALARPAKGPVFQALLGVSAGLLSLLTVIITAAYPGIDFIP